MVGELFAVPFLLDALGAAMRRLSPLPRTSEIDGIILEAYALREAVDAWPVDLPAPERRETTIRRVLRLHAEADRVARGAAGAAADDPTVEMIDRLSHGDYSGALDLADHILAEGPCPLAVICREQCLCLFEDTYARRLDPLDRVPRVTWPVDSAPVGGHKAGFLVSLMDGETSVEGILDVCGMPKGIALKLISELVERGVVDLR